jgi:hypothetical protein
VRDTWKKDLVKIAQHVGERLPLIRRRSRQATPDVTGLDLREHGEFSDAFEIARRPFECGRPVLAKRHFRSFSICGHVRVFST